MEMTSDANRSSGFIKYLSVSYSPAVEFNLFSLNFHPILDDVSVTSLSFGRCFRQIA